uniref:Uncharacterized protein n=1 Tax=Arion vulgaris TaxID=1028688 RepID=A0A0B7BLR8_9EUPU
MRAYRIDEIGSVHTSARLSQVFVCKKVSTLVTLHSSMFKSVQPGHFREI